MVSIITLSYSFLAEAERRRECSLSWYSAHIDPGENISPELVISYRISI